MIICIKFFLFHKSNVDNWSLFIFLFIYIVFDVFQNWCGPCTVMEPVLRKIKLDNEKISVKFFTVCSIICNLQYLVSKSLST